MTKLIAQFFDVVVDAPQIVQKHKKVVRVHAPISTSGRRYTWTLENPGPAADFGRMEGHWSEVRVRQESHGYGIDFVGGAPKTSAIYAVRAIGFRSDPPLPGSGEDQDLRLAQSSSAPCRR